MLMNFFNKLFSRADSIVPITMNAAIQYYILRNNVKELKKYSSTEIINQKYFMSRYPIVDILLKRLVEQSSSIMENGIYDINKSYYVWLRIGEYGSGILKLLSVSYCKNVNTIKTTSKQVKYDNNCVFNDFEAFCIVSVFDYIVQIKDKENSMLAGMKENEVVRKIRDTIC